MMMKLKTVASIAIAVVACVLVSGCPTVAPLPVTPQPPVVTDSGDCPAACDNLRKLGCDEGNPIPTSRQCIDESQCSPGQECKLNVCVASCETFCSDTENSGVWLDPSCVATITSCDQVDTCPTKK